MHTFLVDPPTIKPEHDLFDVSKRPLRLHDRCRHNVSQVVGDVASRSLIANQFDVVVVNENDCGISHYLRGTL